MSEMLPLSWTRAQGITLIKHDSMHPPDILKKQVWRPEVSPADGYSQFWPEIAEQNSFLSLTQLFWSNFSHVLYNTLVAGHHPRSVRSKSSFLLCLRCSYYCLPSSREVLGHSPFCLQKLFRQSGNNSRESLRICSEVCLCSLLFKGLTQEGIQDFDPCFQDCSCNLLLNVKLRRKGHISLRAPLLR